MAAFNKFQDFVEQLCKGVHQLHAAGHTLKVMLTNEAPLAADTVKGDMVEITAEHGYPSGGTDIQNDLSEGSAMTSSPRRTVHRGTGVMIVARAVT